MSATNNNIHTLFCYCWITEIGITNYRETYFILLCTVLFSADNLVCVSNNFITSLKYSKDQWSLLKHFGSRVLKTWKCCACCSNKLPKGRYDCCTKSWIGYAEWLQFLLHFETWDLNFSFLQSGQWAAFSLYFHVHTYVRK